MGFPKHVILNSSCKIVFFFSTMGVQGCGGVQSLDNVAFFFSVTGFGCDVHAVPPIWHSSFQRRVCSLWTCCSWGSSNMAFSTVPPKLHSCSQQRVCKPWMWCSCCSSKRNLASSVQRRVFVLRAFFFSTAGEPGTLLLSGRRAIFGCDVHVPPNGVQSLYAVCILLLNDVCAISGP